MSRARLHEKKDLSKEVRVGQPKGCLRKSCGREGTKDSHEGGGVGEAIRRHALSSLDFIFHPGFLAENKDAVHVY